MSTVDLQFREGDIYHWRYTSNRESEIRKYSCDAYWCKSCIAVVKNGLLYDTYWNYSSPENANWTKDEALRELELTYLGNLMDLDKMQEYMAEYYAESDCVNLNHPNSSKGNFYVRKGAQRSRERMLEVAKYKFDRAEAEAKYAQRTAELLREKINQLEGGADLDGIWL